MVNPAYAGLYRLSYRGMMSTACMVNQIRKIYIPYTTSSVKKKVFPFYPFLSSMMTSLAMAFSVSNTPVPSGSNGLEVRHAAGIQRRLHFLHRYDIRQVPLVVLNDIGNLVEIISLLREIDAQIFDALDIRLHALDLRVRNKHNAVHAFQDQLPACVVEHLAGNGVEDGTGS